jgi:hypothetical protein
VSELITEPADPRDVAIDSEPIAEPVTAPLVLITEQSVVFSTAAATPLPRPTRRRGVMAVLRAIFLSSSQDNAPAPRHYPPRREAFLEQAAMARELHRL